MEVHRLMQNMVFNLIQEGAQIGHGQPMQTTDEKDRFHAYAGTAP